MSLNLVSNANILVIFIALIIAFFLLGIIFGIQINRSRKVPMEDAKKMDKHEPKPNRTDKFGQEEDQEYRHNRDHEQHQQPTESRNRYFY